MGRKFTKAADAVSAELDGFNKTKEAKINLGDGASLKRTLDESATAALKEQGYEEDFTLSNVRIGLGFATCALAAIAQFYPVKYPDNFWILVTCVGLYIATSLVSTLVLGSIEGDIFFTAREKAGQVVCLTSKLPRYSEEYTLTLGRKTSLWSRAVKPSGVWTTRVTEFFDTEGRALEDKFAREFKKALPMPKKQQ